jgi:hypothetical protein
LMRHSKTPEQKAALLIPPPENANPTSPSAAF